MDADQRFHRLDFEREQRIGFRDLGADGVGGDTWIGEGCRNRHRHPQHRGLIRHNVEGGLGIRGERCISDVAHDPDHRARRLRRDGRETKGDLPLQGIHAGHVSARKALVHDRHWCIRRAVIVGEAAALAHADAHRIEESRADDTQSRDDRRRRDAFDMDERRRVGVGTRRKHR